MWASDNVEMSSGNDNGTESGMIALHSGGERLRNAAPSAAFTGRAEIGTRAQPHRPDHFQCSLRVSDDVSHCLSASTWLRRLIPPSAALLSGGQPGLPWSTGLQAVFCYDIWSTRASLAQVVTQNQPLRTLPGQAFSPFYLGVLWCITGQTLCVFQSHQ